MGDLEEPRHGAVYVAHELRGTLGMPTADILAGLGLLEPGERAALARYLTMVTPDREQSCWDGHDWAACQQESCACTCQGCLGHSAGTAPGQRSDADREVFWIMGASVGWSPSGNLPAGAVRVAEEDWPERGYATLFDGGEDDGVG